MAACSTTARQHAGCRRPRPPSRRSPRRELPPLARRDEPAPLAAPVHAVGVRHRRRDLEAEDLGTCNGDPDCRIPGTYCAWDVHRCQKPVPALVSRFLVELYNGAFAPAHNLPRISDFLLSNFKGFTFSVELGTSFMGA